MLGSPLAAPQPRRPRRRRASSVVPTRKTPAVDTYPSKALVFSSAYTQQDDAQIPKSPSPKDPELRMIELYSPSKSWPSQDVLEELCRITRPPAYSNRPRQRQSFLKSPCQSSPSRKTSAVDLADLVSAAHLDRCPNSPQQQGWSITLRNI
ncbi:hypothetical protein NEOLI_000313 [Neolecta irregularis DAH-3]|uniref:Uncharacterized protein n=1 Tax=Neolecta irregularis (strain DAH-3) TaxID=1198029 RepID=A0A1U7LUE2_NEOID|nr:hypothetical protein NEOLI_000313 [Neolecta irregularis DAH-3]|eukprot:OLL26264.1 hypothetical protein NEOLI_000313 [Neolecta irregularis DAH-3]